MGGSFTLLERAAVQRSTLVSNYFTCSSSHSIPGRHCSLLDPPNAPCSLPRQTHPTSCLLPDPLVSPDERLLPPPPRCWKLSQLLTPRLPASASLRKGRGVARRRRSHWPVPGLHFIRPRSSRSFVLSCDGGTTKGRSQTLPARRRNSKTLRACIRSLWMLVILLLSELVSFSFTCVIFRLLCSVAGLTPGPGLGPDPPPAASRPLAPPTLRSVLHCFRCHSAASAGISSLR